jgi:hypothetical protein
MPENEEIAFAGLFIKKIRMNYQLKSAIEVISVAESLHGAHSLVSKMRQAMLTAIRFRWMLDSAKPNAPSCRIL